MILNVQSTIYRGNHPDLTLNTFVTMKAVASAFFDFIQMYVHHVQICVQTRRLAHGPFQLAVH